MGQVLLDLADGLINAPVQRAELFLMLYDVQGARAQPTDAVHGIDHVEHTDSFRGAGQGVTPVQSALRVDQPCPAQRLKHLVKVSYRNPSGLGDVLGDLRQFRGTSEANHRPQCVFGGV
jgi:hypothetical protein